MYVSPASALRRYVKAGLKGGQRNATSGLGVPLVLSAQADDHHMKPPNGSMSKEAESPRSRHHIVIKALPVRVW